MQTNPVPATEESGIIHLVCVTGHVSLLVVVELTLLLLLLLLYNFCLDWKM